jgi:hypothetical protein
VNGEDDKIDADADSDSDSDNDDADDADAVGTTDEVNDCCVNVRLVDVAKNALPEPAAMLLIAVPDDDVVDSVVGAVPEAAGTTAAAAAAAVMALVVMVAVVVLATATAVGVDVAIVFVVVVVVVVLAAIATAAAVGRAVDVGGELP